MDPETGKVRRVFIVDDDDNLRAALYRLLRRAGFDVSGYSSGAQFLAAYDQQPGCLIVDLAMPKMRGEQLMEIVQTEGFNLVAVVLTGHATVKNAVRLGQLGAFDVLEKPADNAVLISTVESALSKGQAFFSRNILARDHHERLDSLTKREFQVYELIVNGMTSTEVANVLGIKRKTVDIFRGNILKKMGCSSAVELAREHTLFTTRIG